MVTLTPDDIRALTGNRGGSTPPSVPDCLPMVTSGLRRDSTKEVIGSSLGQTAVLQSFAASAKSRAEAERERAELDRVIVEAENDGASIEDEDMNLAVEVESDKSVTAEESRTVVGAGDDKGYGQGKNNKLPVVSMTVDSSASLSELSSTFVRASSSSSPLSTTNISKECSVVCGNMVTCEQPALASDCDVSVGGKWLEPHNKKTDSTLADDSVPGPGVHDVSPSRVSPAAAACHVSASQDVRVETVEGSAEACVRGVWVKQEQSSEHDDDDNEMSVNAVALDERLQECEEVKLDPEVMP